MLHRDRAHSANCAEDRMLVRCSSWFGTRPTLCNDRAGWSKQFSLEVPQVQFLPGCGRPCGHAGRPGVPDEAGRCHSFCSSTRCGSEGVFSSFCAFFVLLRFVPELSASRSWGALDDEELFVIEGSGVALTPGVSPRCQATICQFILSVCGQTHPSERSLQNNNNNNTISGGSVLTGEEPPPNFGELKHALSQAGGPTQPQRRKHLLLNPDTNAGKEK